MEKTILSILLAFFLSVATVAGDVLIKEASLHKGFSGWKWLLAGALIWAFTALGWFQLMRREEFSILGALYSLTVVIFLFLLGAFLYKEQITPLEVVGLLMGVGSIIILVRFA